MSFRNSHLGGLLSTLSPLLFTLSFCLLLFCLIPFSSDMAVHPLSTHHLYTPTSDLGHSSLLSTISHQPSTINYQPHLIYIFAHANVLHCLVNTWCLLTLVRILTPLRCIVAYGSAVMASFIPGIITAPTLGLSAVLFWFYGYIAPHLWRTHPSVLLSLIPILLIGFFLPWIAATLHMFMFALGFLFWYTQLFLARLRHFLFV